MLYRKWCEDPLRLCNMKIYNCYKPTIVFSNLRIELKNCNCSLPSSQIIDLFPLLIQGVITKPPLTDQWRYNKISCASVDHIYTGPNTETETETEILESPIKMKLNSFDLCGDVTFVGFPGVKNSDNWNSFRDFVMREFDYSSDCILIGVVSVTDPNNQARVLKLLGDLDSHRVSSSLILTKLDLVSVDDIQTFLDSYLSTFPQVVGIGNMDDGINQKEVLCVDKLNNKIHAAIPKFALRAYFCVFG